jgi:lysophospholipase L1-like esterase
VDKLNELLKALFMVEQMALPASATATATAAASSARVGSIRYLQCGHLFAPTPAQLAQDKQARVNIDLMPDSLHPNAAGMKLWLEECVLPQVRDVMAA